MTDQPEKLDLHSMDLTEDKRLELLALFPEARTEDGKIDFERLKLSLGEMVDVGKERYGMNWPGKADCFRAIQTPSTGTLLPCPEESVNFDTTENMIIEGDNLEVLKLLQKSYLGKIKMIYIDPPYNTGNDFVYPDDFSDSMQNYLEFTGQIDSDGKRFGTNSETVGRFHSCWLNMMYPRIYLAMNLLREDGLIFISINDSEIENLRRVCDEIMGEENFIACFVWQSKKGGGSDTSSVVEDHEYILVYARNATTCELTKTKIDSAELDKIDEKGPYRRGRELNKWGSNSRREDRPTMWFPIPGPNGEEVFPIRNDGMEGRWRWGKKNMLDIVNKGDVEFVKRNDGTYIVFEKIRTTNPRYKPYRTFLTETKTTADGTKEVKILFNDKKVFDFPKPLSLIKKLIEIGSPNDDDIIMDFFAGSGTTGQAVLEYNTDNNFNKSFILIQLPEPCLQNSDASKLGFPTIVEITKERIRRVINKLNENESLQLQFEEPQNRGVRVFKQAPSNFKPWNSKLSKDAAALEKQLELHIDHIREGRSQSDILYEILLKSGFPLTTKIDNLNLAGKHVYSVAESKVLICLERELTLELIQAIADKKPERVICLDAGFAGNDQLKANAVQLFKTHEITSFKTV